MADTGSWALRWVRHDEDGTVISEGGGSIGMSRECAESWLQSPPEMYQYHLIPITDALAMRERFPCADGSGWFRSLSTEQVKIDP